MFINRSLNGIQITFSSITQVQVKSPIKLLTSVTKLFFISEKKTRSFSFVFRKGKTNLIPPHSFISIMTWTSQLSFPYLCLFLFSLKKTKQNQATKKDQESPLKQLSRLSACNSQKFISEQKFLPYSKSTRNKKRLYNERNNTSYLGQIFYFQVVDHQVFLR